MLSFSTLTTFEEFLAFEDQWRMLFARCPAPNPFLSFEWTGCCLQSAGVTRELRIVVASEHGVPVALAPLMLKRTSWRGWPARALVFIGEEHYFRTGFLMAREDPSLAAALLTPIAASFPHDILSLDLVEKGSATDRGIRAFLQESGARHLELASDRSPFIPITTDWAAYLKSRSKNLRHKWNRISNLFDRQGGYRIDHLTGGDLAPALAALAAVSRRTWKYREGTAIVSSAENLRFYTLLADTAARAGWLELWLLWLKGKPVAFAYNLVFDRRVYALQIEFDEEFNSFAPSEFLNTHAVRDSFDRGLLEYDWLGKDLPFKLRWTTTCREHCKHLIFNHSAYAALLHLWKTTFVDPVRTAMERWKKTTSREPALL